MSNSIEERNKGSIFINRLFVVVAIQILCVVVLISRLVYLQIIQFDDFKNKAENNNIKILFTPALRGNFIDRNNNMLTDNRSSYNIIFYKEKNKQKNEEEIQKVIDILNLSPEKVRKIRKELKQNEGKKVIQILNNLTWNELALLQSNLYKIHNIAIEEGTSRRYLYPYEFAHLIGYVGIPNEQEIKRLSRRVSRDILLNPNYKIGKNGFELILNNMLTGKDGYKKIEVDVNNVPLKELEKVPAEPSDDIKLTISLDLQKYVYNRTKDLRGAVVVLNVNTGEVLSIVSFPSYDVNKFVDGVSSEYWSTLINDEKKPLYNKTINALYSPGSTFKIAVALAALKNGTDGNKTIDCNGKFVLNKTEFNCWKRKGHGKLNMLQAIEQSCNVYFMNVGVNTGIENIARTASDLGIGDVFDLKMMDFKKGILPTPEWKKKIYNDVWVRGDTANTSIGQGFLSVNPVQLAVMVSRVANGGYPIKPFILFDDAQTRDYNNLLFTMDPLFKKEHVDLVKLGMYEVINSKNGTASWIKIKDKEKYQICGKTGTAQVVAMNFKEELEKNDTLEERFQNHGLFVGFAPFDKPKYGIAVVIEHGGSGSVAAAPVAMDILKFAIDNNI